MKDVLLFRENREKQEKQEHLQDRPLSYLPDIPNNPDREGIYICIQEILSAKIIYFKERDNG
jgi:hypothetical protein